MTNASDWKKMICLWPRKVDNKWRCLTRVERRYVYLYGALGLLIGAVRVEYRDTQ